MKKITPRRVVSIALALALVGCLGAVGHRLYQYRQGDQVYEQAEQLVELPDLEQITQQQEQLPQTGPQTQPEDSSAAAAENQEPVYVDPYADALASMDFAALREVNDDVLGWIVIPGTRVSYPIVQGEDNSYYLNRTWSKTRNSVGSIFMEHRCSSRLSDFNTIIYGHRVNNRSMFGSLLQYKSLSYAQQHPKVYITTDSGSHAYQIFAAYEVALDSPTYWLKVGLQQDKQAVIDYALAQSVIDTGIVPRWYDQILTLSTCTGNGHSTRWVVQAVKWGQEPELPAEPDVPEVSQQPEPSVGTETPAQPPVDQQSGLSVDTGEEDGQEAQPPVNFRPDLPRDSQ